ncbi:hypothetical protein ACHAQJ_007095 [Trichoderma viride]
MAQTHNVKNPAAYPARLTLQACRNDDVPLMVQAISMASSPESRNTVQDVIKAGLRNSLAREAPRVLTYLLDHGADVSTVTAGMMGMKEELVKPSLEVLEILVAHGWDVNARSHDTDWPLLWCVLSYPDLVEWCLAQGASVYLPGDTPPRDAKGVGRVPRQSLLECAAQGATVATFELLRAKGAPLPRRTLHRAVGSAVHYMPPYDPPRDPISDAAFRERTDMAGYLASCKERMAMVRHLVDVVGFDVNAEEGWPGKNYATPLLFVAEYKNGRDARELIWFLLDRGADPNRASTGGESRMPTPSALEYAQTIHNTCFLEAVQEWQER